jgi:1-acyl-sn-glycerol-3-phosphate acyltransferase
MADASVDAERSRQPRSGNALTRGLGQSLLRLGGWRIDGTVPDEPKLLLLGAPHTSYFDFVLTKLTAWAVGVRLSWVGKKSLFPRPIAPLVRWYGGIPVNRETSEGFVAEIVAEFRQRDRFYLAMMPGGGIRTSRWRSGFYHIAQGAEVPMLLIAFDWGQRTMRIGPMLTVTPDAIVDDEVERIKAHFEGVRGREPAMYRQRRKSRRSGL